MESFWDKLKHGIREGASASAEKVEMYSKIGRLKIEQYNQKKLIQKCEHDLGVFLYHLIKNEKADGVATNEIVVDLVTQIDDAKIEIDKIATKIAAIKSEKGIDGDDDDEEIFGA